MADTAGQALIRGIDIDKTSRDYFEENLLFKKEVTVETTPSREVRWYQKTSGYLTLSTPAKISSIAYGAVPFVAEDSWTRNTSYVKKYMLDSPFINMEDESDSDVQVFMNNADDIALAIANDLDGDIWDVVSESQSPSNINSVTSTAAWDAGSGQDPYEDIAEAEQLIREQTKRNPKNLVIYLSAKGYKDLKVWCVSTKGTSIPGFSSQLIENGRIETFDGKRVVVSENVTADYAMVADLKEAAVYKEFKPLTTVFIEEPGVGRKIRSWAHGITILRKPKYVALISNTEA